MIQAVAAANSHLFEKELLDYYRVRHQIFVGERGWKQVARPDGLEKDQFDTNDAIYILGIENGSVYGGARLVPTVKPHLLSEVFPHLASVHSVPREPGVFEWTRIFVVKAKREGRNAGQTAGTVICGLLEFCLEEGIYALSGVIDAWWLPRFHDMGWTVRPLGLPELVDKDWVVAVVMPIDDETLRKTRAFHGIEGPVLIRRGLEFPVVRELVS
jgi:acyl-homoserine lactone synthase